MGPSERGFSSGQWSQKGMKMDRLEGMLKGGWEAKEGCQVELCRKMGALSTPRGGVPS